MSGWDDLGKVTGNGLFLKLTPNVDVKGVFLGEPELHTMVWKDGKASKRVKFNVAIEEAGSFAVKIWDAPLSVGNTVAQLRKDGYDLNRTLMTITRTGSDMTTKYSVRPSPKPLDEATAAKLKALPLNDLKDKTGGSAREEVGKHYPLEQPIPPANSKKTDEELNDFF